MFLIGGIFCYLSGKYSFTCLLFEKIEVFLCFTPPENAFGNQLFLNSRFLVDFATFRSYESKK